MFINGFANETKVEKVLANNNKEQRTTIPMKIFIKKKNRKIMNLTSISNEHFNNWVIWCFINCGKKN